MSSKLPLKKNRRYRIILVLAGLLVLVAVAFWVFRVPSAPVSVSLPEAQRQVSFTIPQPKWLPAELQFQGAQVASSDWVRLLYHKTDVPDSYLDIEVTHGPRVGKYAYPATATQSVVVNGKPAVYVHGGTYEQGWDAAADAGAIEWEANGYLYLVSCSKLGLGQDDLVRIATALE